MLNNVCLVGRLVSDPQITPLKEGTVTSFTLAIREGEEKVSFIDCKAFDNAALEGYCHKGDKIAVSGSLTQETWQAKDGGNRSKVLVKVRSIEFCSDRPAEDFQAVEEEEISEPAPEPKKKPVATKPYRK